MIRVIVLMTLMPDAGVREVIIALAGDLALVPWGAGLGADVGPAGTDKAAAEQKLLDTAMERYPHLFTMDRLWLMDRNFPGAARIARLIARTHVLIQLKSDIPLTRITKILPDGSYLAEITGDGVTVTVRVIEYFIDIEGQAVDEMFCLITYLTDITEYPARELAALYRWRWDGSETALREAKTSLRGAGPGTGPMLRSGTPELARQELAAWAVGAEMTRGVARDAVVDPPAASAAPAARTPPPEQPKPSSPWPTNPSDQHKHLQSDLVGHSSARGTGRQPARHADPQHARIQKLPTVTKPGNSH